MTDRQQANESYTLPPRSDRWRERRAMRLLRRFRTPGSLPGRPGQIMLAAIAAMGMVAIAACGGGTPKAAPSQDSSDLTVWVDAARLPVAQAYVKEHPNVHVNVVTFDGDGNGATT